GGSRATVAARSPTPVARLSKRRAMCERLPVASTRMGAERLKGTPPLSPATVQPAPTCSRHAELVEENPRAPHVTACWTRWRSKALRRMFIPSPCPWLAYARRTGTSADHCDLTPGLSATMPSNVVV